VIADVNLFGIFINAGLVSALFAGVLLVLLRRALTRAGAYRLVWHPALFDLALFVLLWGGVAFGATALEVRLVSLLG
jgi:protein AaeX